MYSVSLLPYEYRIINTKAKKKSFNLFIAMGAMGVFFVVYFILTIVLAGKNTELNSIRNEADIVEAQISEIDDILTISNDVNLLLKDVSLAAGKNPEWGRLITAIGNSVPESVNLVNTEMKFEDSKGECSIQGVGLSNKSVSDWIQKLEEVDNLGEIKCIISTLSDPKVENSPVNFELSIELPEGPGYQLPMEVTGNE